MCGVWIDDRRGGGHAQCLETHFVGTDEQQDGAREEERESIESSSISS